MLRPDTASEALKKLQATEDQIVAGIRVHDESAVAQAVADALSDPRRNWWPVALELESLSASEQKAAFTALAPELGADLARWWNWSSAQPYQRGWNRRAYRSPDPVDSLAARWHELDELLRHAVRFPYPLEWQATWASHLAEAVALGPVFASAIDSGCAEIAEIVRSSLLGRHDISGPTHHAFVALLGSSSSSDWERVGDLLVTAQRAEGLRQAILEAADLAHPDAFAHVLRLVGEHSLERFAGTVRAAGVWLGEDLTVRHEKQVTGLISRLAELVRHPPSPEDISDSDPNAAYLGLWTIAFRDVQQAIVAVDRLQNSDVTGVRLAAARLLVDFDVVECDTGLARSITDPSLPVFAAASCAWSPNMQSDGDRSMPEVIWAEVRRRVATVPVKTEVDIGVLAPRPQQVSRTLTADLALCHGGEAELDGDLVASSSSHGRWYAARRWAEQPTENREALFSLLTDRSSSVREVVIAAVGRLNELRDDEVRQLEDVLRRKSADLRTAALSLLRTQDEEALSVTLDRLGAGTPDQRRAAEELVAGLKDERPFSDSTSALRYTSAERTPSVRPELADPACWGRYHTGAHRVMSSLRAWLDEHADVEVQTHGRIVLLANLWWVESGRVGEMVLPEIVGPWWERVAPDLVEGGVEAALIVALRHRPGGWATQVATTVLGPDASSIVAAEDGLIFRILESVVDHAWRPNWADVLVDLLEYVAASLPVDGVSGHPEVLEHRGRVPEIDQWGTDVTRDARSDFTGLWFADNSLLRPDRLTPEQLSRVWSASRFLDEPEGTLDRWTGPMLTVEPRQPVPTQTAQRVLDQPDRWRAPVATLVAAFECGAATRADVLDALVAQAGSRPLGGWRTSALSALSRPRPEPWASSPTIQQVVDELRIAVVDAETHRGDLPTEWSDTAANLGSTRGVDQLVRCVAALGNRPFVRGYQWTASRESVLSHLVQVNQPGPHDTVKAFSGLLGQYPVAEHRLIETAIYAPQWADVIGRHLGWPGFESAVWWVHAHTKGEDWSVSRQIREQWVSSVSRRTPLDPARLLDGAADVTWFTEIVADLGPERFAIVLEAAKYASSAGGHKRAQLFAEALSGGIDESTLMGRIREKRHQDSVRALGLLPITEPSDVVRRYEHLRSFVASDRTSGSQRRASETTAVEIGLENLARSAGFADPQRLVWAMEAEAVRDLAEGPVFAVDGDLVVTLSIDAVGVPQATVARTGRPLKAIPAASAKVPAIAAIRDRVTSLRQQQRRMRTSLELALVVGERLEGEDVQALQRHPIMAPMIKELVFADEEGMTGWLVGPSELAGANGELRQVSGGLRVAHPIDLLHSGDWAELQHQLMSEGRRQPFKQLFRELYTRVADEGDLDLASGRYAGHQLESRQAAGIFTSRGWAVEADAGFSRTFHRQRITATCFLATGGGTPADVGPMTLADVRFTPSRSHSPLLLGDVPDRIFSETMRDLDLVVSVAHAGGVDPEASVSTSTMRGRLVDETASMLGLTNVEVTDHHVRVLGSLATYSVHLGSGVVHRIPGQALCIVPVSTQHRGRVFLPFADDDPRTAEVVAKVLLLANDHGIRDPTILAQIVG